MGRGESIVRAQYGRGTLHEGPDRKGIGLGGHDGAGDLGRHLGMELDAHHAVAVGEGLVGARSASGLEPASLF